MLCCRPHYLYGWLIVISPFDHAPKNIDHEFVKLLQFRWSNE